MKIEGGNELPKELPKELQEKFEVREISPGSKPAEEVAPKAELTAPPALKKVPSKGKKEASKLSVNPAPEVAQMPVIQFPSRRPSKEPIWLSERLVYEVTYFGMSAGDFTLEVLPYKMVGDRKVYHIRGNAVSSKVFSLFYRLNDMVETFIDYDGLFSHRFHIELDETKQTRDSLELYDSEKLQTYYWNRWQRKDHPFVETKEFFPIQPFPQDSLSALYFLRTVPLPEGGMVTFPVVSEGKTWDAEISVVRREVLNTPLGRVQTVVLKPETKYQGILQKRGDSFLWMTDDDRRLLVRLEAKVKIGSVVATLKKVELGVPPEQLPSPVTQRKPTAAQPPNSNEQF